MQGKWNGRNSFVRVAAKAAALIFCLVLLAAPGYGQSFTGRWAATGQPLHNGELHKSILDLTQNGSEIKGKLTALGYGVDVKGTATGNHFVLYAWDHKKPVIEGDLVNGELHYDQWGGAFVAHPATAADEFPKLAYLEPPALHTVPYNGLAKTPPMGWNSWNQFAEKIDDKTVRDHGRCDGYRAACATRATCMSTSTTPGKACATPRAICNRTASFPT